jgi:hypothetical protein
MIDSNLKFCMGGNPKLTTRRRMYLFDLVMNDIDLYGIYIYIYIFIYKFIYLSFYLSIFNETNIYHINNNYVYPLLT